MKESEKVIAWIQDYFEKNGKGCKAVIGISGGTDSSVVCTLLVKALGKERVVPVLIPNGTQHDIDVSYELIDFLGLKPLVINIRDTYQALTEAIEKELDTSLSNCDCYYTNTPSRLRMTVLYGISAYVNGRVANTCNLSEDYIGYSTKFGDAAGDFSPLSSFTKTEVRDLGKELGLPIKFVEKTPEDGMSGKSDEEKLGFTYEVLDRYIKTGEIESPILKEKINRLHKNNLHKLQKMPSYQRS